MTTLCRLPPEVRDKPFDGRRVHLKVIDTQCADFRFGPTCLSFKSNGESATALPAARQQLRGQHLRAFLG
jgi:hypothetical protein